MTVQLDLTPLTHTQLSRISLVAGLVKRREAGKLAGRIAAAVRLAADAEERRRMAYIPGHLVTVPIELDQDAPPAVVDAELQNAIATFVTVRDSSGTEDAAREAWNTILIALAELRDGRAAGRHNVLHLMYGDGSLGDDAA
jgi:hypothetical protein